VALCGRLTSEAVNSHPPAGVVEHRPEGGASLLSLTGRIVPESRPNAAFKVEPEGHHRLTMDRARIRDPLGMRREVLDHFPKRAGANPNDGRPRYVIEVREGPCIDRIGGVANDDPALRVDLEANLQAPAGFVIDLSHDFRLHPFARQPLFKMLKVVAQPIELVQDAPIVCGELVASGSRGDREQRRNVLGADGDEVDIDFNLAAQLVARD